MRISLLKRIGLLVSSLLLLGPMPPPQEEVCEASRLSYRSNYLERLENGPEARLQLLQELDRLIDQYEPTAPVCAGRLREIEAYLLVLNEEYAEAARRLSAFLAGRGHAASLPSQVRLTNLRGYALTMIGEIREGAQDYFAAAALASQVDALSGVRLLIDAARIARFLDDDEASQRYLDSGFTLLEDSIDTDPRMHEQLGHALTSQSLLYDKRIDAMAEGSARDSLVVRLEEVARDALEILPDTPRGNGFRSLVVGLYAVAAARRGNHDLAQRRSRGMMTWAKEAGTLLPAGVWDAWLIRSRLAELRGDLRTAEEAARQARLEAIRLPPSNLEAIAIERLGHIAELRGRWKEAEHHYREAIDHHEVRRARLGLQDWTAQSQGDIEGAYRGLARSLFALGEPEEAFWTLDRTRARYLRDLQHHFEVRSRLSTQEKEKADSLQSALESARFSLLRPGLTGAERATVTFSVSALQEKLDSLTKVKPISTPSVTMDELQSSLHASGQTLLSYFVDSKGSVVFVVRPDTFVTVPLNVTPLSIETLMASIGSPWNDSSTSVDPAFRLDVLNTLYGEVVSPLAHWIEESPSLIVIPDGPLAGLPFGMMISAPSTTYEDAPYLIRDRAITTELAAALVVDSVRVSSQEESPLDLLAFGRSQFGRFTWNGRAMQDLPHVQEEIREISKGITHSLIAIDEGATESELEKHLTHAKIIHLASHAETDPILPLYSRIALWGGNNDDGILHLYELQSHALPANLVVLSGCSTARGTRQAGEGMIGLQYAVRSAGAQASLATLWPVDDEATVEIMKVFYDGLKRGLPKDVALQKAQLLYLDTNTGLEASPFFWAAAILSGNTAPIHIEVSNPERKWLAISIILFGVWVTWRFKRRRRYERFICTL